MGSNLHLDPFTPGRELAVWRGWMLDWLPNWTRNTLNQVFNALVYRMLVVHGPIHRILILWMVQSCQVRFRHNNVDCVMSSNLKIPQVLNEKYQIYSGIGRITLVHCHWSLNSGFVNTQQYCHPNPFVCTCEIQYRKLSTFSAYLLLRESQFKAVLVGFTYQKYIKAY